MSPDDPLFAEVRGIVEEIAAHRAPADVGPDTRLAEDYWLDSIEMLEVLIQCEAALGVTLDERGDFDAGALRHAREPDRVAPIEGGRPEQRVMTQPAADTSVDLIGTDLSHGPARLAPWISALRTLPYPVTSNLLAAASVADGVVRNGRFRRALSWARDRGFGRTGQWRLAVALLANHGKFVAEEAVLGASSLE